MSLSIVFLLALMVPAQGPQSPDQYQLGSRPAPLFEALQHPNQQQSRLVFVRPSVQNQSQSSDWLGPLPQFQGPLRQFQTRNFTSEDFLAEQNSHMCLALRVYHFERNDGGAPVLVKTLTCTPNTAFLKRARPTPQGLYVPLKLSY